MDGIEQRLAKLERQNRWLKATAICAAVALGIAANDDGPKIIQAKQFQAIDGKGIMRGLLIADDELGAGLVLCDAKGRNGMKLRVSNDGKAAIDLGGEAQKAAIVIRDDSGKIIWRAP